MSPTRAQRAVVAGLALLLGACAATTLTNAWKDPEYEGSGFRKLLVVGASDSPTHRRIFEEEFARALRAAGVEAVPSYTVIARDGTKIDEAAMKDIVRKRGLDGVVMTRLVRMDTQTVYTPGYAWGVPALAYRNSLYGYYDGAWSPYALPAQVQQYESAVLETTLWDAAEDKLVWTATTSTFAPSSVKSATSDYAKVVIEELKARTLI
ncbi:MAG: hypothetical protein R3357_06935 [Burkholderiales bacterium]|nr:hypothetical protein [Burkholderiales bacterium]